GDGSESKTRGCETALALRANQGAGCRVELQKPSRRRSRSRKTRTILQATDLSAKSRRRYCDPPRSEARSLRRRTGARKRKEGAAGFTGKSGRPHLRLYLRQ